MCAWVYVRFGSIYLGCERLQVTFHGKVQVATTLDDARIAFRDSKFNLQRRDFGQCSHHGRCVDKCTFTHLAKTNDAVERSAQLSVCDVCLHHIDFSFQHSQVCLHLFVSFLTDRFFFQQGILTEYTVFCQLQLHFQLAELGLQLGIVHLGEQFALLHLCTFCKVDGGNLTGCFKRKVYFFVRKQETTDGDTV